ncbi:DUF6457 domain-containing protein [Aeromicrobium sp.]|uniref:DUF6457 domain-containing protein n=1 Tax=Aeromicrobium sp. TaxID=1871063 RepID=UPI0025B96B4A|nr:DUF6457 domain-containing protein [Aeromicrobium sp.]MCK5892397.1 molybdopterin-guanine dinucleotide biosynthesis protein [Aeromicrobium sp.]
MSDQDTVLAAWVADVGRELGVDLEVEVGVVLDLAGDAAHAVVRPAAPLTTFLVGVAVGRGARLDDALEAVGRVLARRAAPQD